MHDRPQDYIILRPNTYAVIADPITEKKVPKVNKHGSIMVRHGEQEIRTDTEYPDPFPLYPGEILKKIDNLTVVPRDCALKIKANRVFFREKDKKVEAGQEWLIYGPTIYTPRIEEDKVQLIQPITIEINTGIKLRAKIDCEDYEKKPRAAGEEWLVKRPGNYLLGINEVFVEKVQGTILTDKRALKLTALRTFEDVYHIKRKAGEEWLVTNAESPLHICDVYEKIVDLVDIVILKKNEHCYKLNPLVDGVNQMGKRVLVKGPTAFFLNPGECLDKDRVFENYVLTADEGLLLKAVENFEDSEFGAKVPGDWWMVLGPRYFIPPVEVEVVERRKAIPLDKTEGIYVREYKHGTVRAVIGQTYMLEADEVLANKDIPDSVSTLLVKCGMPRRQPHEVVTYKVPYNTAVQIYDYKTKASRVVFGPDLVMLNPDEQFTVNYLSGGTPKKPGKLVSLYLNLGPCFSTDVIEKVETGDHARLELRLSYNWYFKIADKIADGSKIFSVRDCIGDMCSCMASKVRATVATHTFDSFHKSSARIIRSAIFGIVQDHVKISIS